MRTYPRFIAAAVCDLNETPMLRCDRHIRTFNAVSADVCRLAASPRTRQSAVVLPPQLHVSELISDAVTQRIVLADTLFSAATLLVASCVYITTKSRRCQQPLMITLIHIIMHITFMCTL